MEQHKKFIVIILLMPALLLSVFMYFSSYYNEKTKPEIKEGVLDLEGWREKGCTSFQLSGEWQMYPGHFLNTEEAFNNRVNSYIIELPYSSTRAGMDSQNPPIPDDAAFRIHVINSPTGIDLAIRIKQMTAAYRLYADTKLIAENGSVNDDSLTEISEYRYNTVCFTPQSSSYDIIIQIANQYDNKGLIHWPIEVGSYDAMANSNHIVSVISYLTLGAIVMLVFFLFIFWLNMPHEKELLLLCLFGITTLIRISLNQDILIADILPGLPVLILSNLDYTAAFVIQYLAPASILAAYRNLYPKRNMKILLFYTLLIIVWTWAAPAFVHSDISQLFDFIMMLIFIYTIIVLARAVRESSPGSSALLVSVSCSVALMLIGYRIKDSYLIYYLLSGSGLGFCLVIFVQCFLLAKHFKEAFNLELNALKGQIRPHFIHNSLATIIAISRIDPDRSRDLLVDFSDYLRGTFDYTAFDCISIEQEMEMVKAYVALEKARFGDKYKVLYLIEAENFLVPPLILQPLVENALVHGLRGKEEEGTVIVYTQRRNKNVRVGVRDDGLGVSDKCIQDKGRKGIGLDNINRRLWRLYGRQLQYNLPPNGGFEVYLEIPYREVMKNECHTG